MKSSDNDIYIYAQWIIDGLGHVLQDQIIHIQDHFIQSIQKAAPDSHHPCHIYLSQCTVLPWLIDAHVHLCLSGSLDLSIRQNQLNQSHDDIQSKIWEHIQQHISYGIGGVRDGGDQWANGLIVRHQLKTSPLSFFTYQTPGTAWFKKGRYGTFVGRPIHQVQEIENAVTQESNQVDIIKIIQSGMNSLDTLGKETLPQFSLSEMNHIKAIATRLQKQIMVHANGKKPVQIAIESGCHSIEHGFFMGEDNLYRMADKQIIWVPTICTMKAASCFSIEYKHREIAKQTFDHQMEQLQKAKTLGVPVTMGTDSGCPGVHHGQALIDEMALFLEAGYSISDIIQSSTQLGASLINLSYSGLFPGAPARFIAVDGSPDNLPHSLNQIRYQIY